LKCFHLVVANTDMWISCEAVSSSL